jgi:tetratricopeptide (TPR) repeat protein
MFDYTSLTKSLPPENGPATTQAGSAWWAGDQTPTGAASHYTPSFLTDYLLHYCRLCERTHRQGTIPVLLALLEVEPDNGDVHFMLARQYEMAGDREAAMPCFERAAALCPEMPKYTLAAVQAAAYLGDRSRAMALVNSVIEAYPIMAEAWYERAVIHEIDENWNRALQDLNHCNRLEPNNTDYLCDIARMYRIQKLHKLARQFAEKALRIDPKCARAHDELRLLPLINPFSSMLRKDAFDPSGASDPPKTSQRN